MHELGQEVPLRAAGPPEIRTMRRCRRPDSSWGKQVMQQEEPGGGGPLAPLVLRKIGPIDAAAASDRLGWVGLDASRYRESPAFEFNPPATTHHRLILYTRSPEELDLLYEGVKRHVPRLVGVTPRQFRMSARIA